MNWRHNDYDQPDYETGSVNIPCSCCFKPFDFDEDTDDERQICPDCLREIEIISAEIDEDYTDSLAERSLKALARL